MRNTIILLIFLSIIALVLGWWSFVGMRREQVSELPILRVGEVTVSVEIADSPEEQKQGLSGRESLAEDEGMLFIFPDSQRWSFWMKAMRFGLDIIFIDDGQVVEIAREVPVPKEGEDGAKISLIPNYPAEWVLEVNSGWAERHGIRVGDAVSLE